MNSYFPNPFLSSLQGDGQPATSSIPCNFGGLSSRYDHQQGSQGIFCSTAGNQGLSGQYNSPTSPNHHPHMTAAGGDPGGCGATRPSEINGYEQGAAGHLGSPSSWPGQHGSSTPTGGGGGAGGQPSDYSTHNHHTPPICTENSMSCSTTSPNSYSASQPIPFYPWMGVVGKYHSILDLNLIYLDQCHLCTILLQLCCRKNDSMIAIIGHKRWRGRLFVPYHITMLYYTIRCLTQRIAWPIYDPL